jgi:hypothetical protein
MGEAARFMENTWRFGENTGRLWGDPGELKKVDAWRLQITYYAEESHGDSGDIYEEEIQRDLEEAQQDAKRFMED